MLPRWLILLTTVRNILIFFFLLARSSCGAVWIKLAGLCTFYEVNKGRISAEVFL